MPNYNEYTVHIAVSYIFFIIINVFSAEESVTIHTEDEVYLLKPSISKFRI